MRHFIQLPEGTYVAVDKIVSFGVSKSPKDSGQTFIECVNSMEESSMFVTSATPEKIVEALKQPFPAPERGGGKNDIPGTLFICSRCGAPADDKKCDGLDSGTTLICDKCGQETIVELHTPEHYVNSTAPKPTPAWRDGVLSKSEAQMSEPIKMTSDQIADWRRQLVLMNGLNSKPDAQRIWLNPSEQIELANKVISLIDRIDTLTAENERLRQSAPQGLVEAVKQLQRVVFDFFHDDVTDRDELLRRVELADRAVDSALSTVQPKVCVWTDRGDGEFDTSCGKSIVFDEEREDDQKYCCFCACTIRVEESK